MAALFFFVGLTPLGRGRAVEERLLLALFYYMGGRRVKRRPLDSFLFLSTLFFA